MRVVQGLGRGAAVALLLSVVSSVAGAAPFEMRGQVPASRGWLASPAVDVPDPCAQHVIACRAGRFGELADAHTRSLLGRFAAQLAEALSPAIDIVDLHAADPVAWVYADSITGIGAHARLALSVAATGPTPEATLLEDVAGLVRQVPEPSLLVTVVLGLAWARGRMAGRFPAERRR